MEYDELDGFLFHQGFRTTFGEMIEKIQNVSNDSLLELFGYVGDVFITNLGQIKTQLLELLGICLFFAFVQQLSKEYGKDQIQKYGNYIYFVCGATICLNLFMNGYETVYGTVRLLIQFMELLLPTYTFAVIFSNGTKTSAAYYGIILLILFIAECVLCAVFLPGSKIYMAIRFVNEGIDEPLFTKFLKLFEDCFSWGLKGILIGICSMNTIQSLIVPSIDKVRELSTNKTVSMIPGIGKLAGSATELLLGTGALIKNSLGAASIIVLIAICLPSIVKMLAMIIGIRLLDACMEPLVGKRIAGLLEGCYKSIQLLLKVQVNVLALFSLTLVILTAFS